MRLRSRAAGLLWLLAACGAEPPTAPDALPVDPGQPRDDDGAPPVALAGAFSGLGSYAASGQVRVVFDDGTATIVLDADVRFSAVPGPVLYLNTTDNANTGAPLRIAALDRSGGAARFVVEVVPGVEYTRVLIWCDPFNVGVGSASLVAPGSP